MLRVIVSEEIGALAGWPGFNPRPMSIYLERDISAAEIINSDLFSLSRLFRLDFSFKLRRIVERSNQVSILLALDRDRFRACKDYRAAKLILLLARLCGN